MGELPQTLPGPRPMFFFAPDRVNKRSADWGRDGLEQRLADAWRPYLEWTGSWLQVIHGEGSEALEGAYLDLLDGASIPRRRTCSRCRAECARLRRGRQGTVPAPRRR